jgi:hypothetical protein
LATAEVLAQAADPSMAGYEEAIFPGEVPSGAERVLPQLLNGNTIDLEGDFSRIVAEETTAAGIVAGMVELYPDWENGRTLWHSARTAIGRKQT